MLGKEVQWLAAINIGTFRNASRLTTIIECAAADDKKKVVRRRAIGKVVVLINSLGCNQRSPIHWCEQGIYLINHLTTLIKY